MSGPNDGSVDAADGEVASRPVLRVIRGNPTPEEIAVVAVVLTAISGDSGSDSNAEPLRLRGGWADPALRLRQALQPGPGAWRASAGR